MPLRDVFTHALHAVVDRVNSFQSLSPHFRRLRHHCGDLLFPLRGSLLLLILPLACVRLTTRVLYNVQPSALYFVALGAIVMGLLLYNIHVSAGSDTAESLESLEETDSSDTFDPFPRHEEGIRLAVTSSAAHARLSSSLTLSAS